MKPTSKLFIISQASKELGYYSRSTLYRLLEKGYFDEYLWTEGKRKYFELNPRGKKTLAQKNRI